MDQLAREDITAAAAVHQELGREYDRAVAEGLIERIGEEIDKRVDARLAAPGGRTRPAELREPGRLARPGTRSSWPGVVLALGSMGIGAAITGGVVAASSQIGPQITSHTLGWSQDMIIIVLWVVICVINVACARRR